MQVSKDYNVIKSHIFRAFRAEKNSPDKNNFVFSLGPMKLIKHVQDSPVYTYLELIYSFTVYTALKFGFFYTKGF